MHYLQKEAPRQEKTRFPLRAVYDVLCEHASKYPLMRGRLAYQCLLDSARTMALMRIVTDVTREGSLGIDLGAGFGPLAFAFLNAGGGKVIAIEKDPELCEVMRNIAARFVWGKRIKVMNADLLAGSGFDLPSGINRGIGCVMAELVDTGLAREALVPAILRIRRYAAPDAVYIPQMAISTITLTGAPFPLSSSCEYDRTDIRMVRGNMVHVRLPVRIICGALREEMKGSMLNTSLVHPNGQVTGRYDTLCQPYEPPTRIVGEKIVRNGQMVMVEIKYEYGADNARVMVTSGSRQE